MLSVKFLVAGLGSIGQRHIRNLRRLAPVEIIAYRVRGHSLPAEFQGDWLTETTNLEHALSLGPAAVLVCNPPSLMLPVALAAARAGCHLFIEKPLSHALEGVEGLVSLVQGKKLLSLIGFNLRFHPGLQLVKSLLIEGRLGRVVSIQAQVGQYLPDWHPSEDYRQGYSARHDLGGGVILDLIHELDYVRWLGGEVRRVACFAGHISSLAVSTEDVAEILLGFADQAIGSVHVDYVQRVPSRTCRIVGEAGTVLWDYFANEVRFFEKRQSDWQVFRQEGYERNEMYLAEMQHFLACIEGREHPVVDVAEGAKILRLALAARTSAQTGAVCDLS
jgi:predicted dehydrogenase